MTNKSIKELAYELQKGLENEFGNISNSELDTMSGSRTKEYVIYLHIDIYLKELSR